MIATISRPPLSDRLISSKVIAVLRASGVSALASVCDVLVEEGILSLELTLTTPGLLDALSELVDRYADTADVGVGTILTESEAQRALDSGAQYLVTPTMNLPVVKLAAERQIAVFPGGLTPTELAAGWHAGATAVKIFPAQTVGAGYLKHLQGPFPDLEAIPSGGVDLGAAREWLNAGAAAVSIGGPLLGDSLKGGDLSALRERCRAVRAVIMETVPS
ncbi:MAG TPA: bifunctional 4-hydroxy-2-oxoglutarate aldolase/2-dehydro-3-deoxy-phosphogluconate aldolase [Propionibacteriaceae bacterium]